MEKIKSIVLYFAFFFLLSALAGAIVSGTGLVFANQPMDQMTGLQMLLAEGFTALLATIWFLWRKWTPVSGNWLKTRPTTVLIWVAIAVLGTILPSMWLEELLSFLPDISSADLMKIMEQQGGFFVIGILVPLAEEIVFRGAILRTLLNHQAPTMGRWTAISISALIFGLAHINPVQIPHAFLLGLFLGWLYERTGSIVPGVVAHVVNNTVCFILARLYINNPDITVSELFGSQGRALLAVLFSLFIFLPALYQLHLRLKKASDEPDDERK